VCAWVCVFHWGGGAAPAALLVTLLYWLLVFDGTTNFSDTQVHATNFLIVFIDLTLSRLPFFYKHM
jgi:hypothetical protein